MALAMSQKLPRISAPAREPRQPAGLRFHFFVLMAAVLLGALIQLRGPAWSSPILDQIKIDSFSGAGTLVLALLLSIFVHELGHLLAARFLNFAVLGGAIGPFRFEKQHRTSLFHYAKEGWFRCSISAVPREMHNGWRGRTMMVVAAGPAATLILLMISASSALNNPGLNAGGNWLAQFWSACAAVNFFLFVLGLIPNGRFANVRNDAALFLALYQNAADAVDMMVCHQAIELGLRGIRPQDYPEPLMLELAKFNGRPYTNLMVARRMLEWAADCGDIAMAGQWDQYVLSASEKCSPRLANVCLAESACFEVIFRNDMRAARRKFAEVDFDSLFPPALAERTQASRLIACDLPHWAPTHILQAQYHLPLGIPYYNYERMLLDKLHLKVLAQCPPECGTAIVPIRGK
jgi:Zn-dependent protease